MQIYLYVCKLFVHCCSAPVYVILPLRVLIMSFLIILEVVQGQRNKLYPILSNYILVSGQDPPGPAKSHRALQHADPPQRAGQDRGGDRGEVPNMEPPRKFPRMEPLVGSSGATEVSEEWEALTHEEEEEQDENSSQYSEKRSRNGRRREFKKHH